MCGHISIYYKNKEADGVIIRQLTKKIILLDEFLKQAKPHETVNQFDFSSMLLIFLCYINVDRKGIPVMEVFV